MLNHRYGILYVSLAISLAACSASPTREDIIQSDIKAQKVMDQAREERLEKRQKSNEQYLKAIPDWALNPPSSSPTGFYGVGIGDGENVSLAIRKARLEAEFSLAKVYGQALSGSEQRFDEEKGDRVLSRYTTIIDKVIDNVPVNGYEVTEQEVVSIEGKYTAFVLLKLPYDEFNQVLKSQRAMNDDHRINSAFDKLQARLDDRRKASIVRTKEE